MNWTILNVSIPVHDLDKSKEFYEMLLGITEDQEELYQPLFQNEESVFLGDKGFGLRLFKPKPDLLVSDNIQSRRSFVTLLVESIDHIKRNLEAENIKFKINDFNNGKHIKSIFVQEPSLNLIHLVENKNGFNDDLNGWNMGLDWGIHHMNLESLNVRNSIEFFSDIVGMKEGRWVAPVNKGDFSIDPSELAILPLSNNNRGLHVIKPDDGLDIETTLHIILQLEAIQLLQ